MKQILIIDDDLHIGNMLEETLTREGYRVSRAYSGTEALFVLAQSRPDLVLLDLMLPGLDGEEVLPKIKNIPVIIVSAKVDIDNKVALLLGGAADYVTKPFDTKELLARIAVQLRNAAVSGAARTLTVEDITLHIDTHLVEISLPGEMSQEKTSQGKISQEKMSQEIKLTRTEFAILKLLMQNSAQVVTKSVLLERISEDTPDCTETSLKMHISNLRRKLREISGKDYIEAVWGIGFKLRGGE